MEVIEAILRSIEHVQSTNRGPFEMVCTPLSDADMFAFPASEP